MNARWNSAHTFPPIESLIIQQKTIPSDRRLFRVLKGSVTATCTAFKVARCSAASLQRYITGWTVALLA
jgi:hypothetical protein